MGCTAMFLLGITPIRVGGTEVLLREAALRLGEKGWRSVAVFDGEAHPAVRDYLAIPGLSLESLPGLGKRRWAELMSLNSLLHRYCPDILYLQFMAFISPLPWLGRLHGAKKIFFNAQGSEPEEVVLRPAAYWKRAAARVINLPVNRIFCGSEFVKRSLCARQTVSPDRLHRIYNSTRLPSLADCCARAAAFRSNCGIPDGKRLVVQISWLIPEKGISDFLEMARLVAAAATDVHFAIVGSGPSHEAFREQARSLGVEKVVTFTGRVADVTEEGVYAAADICCQLSRWEEAFGWVIVEAMSSARPVVATKVGGIPEIVEDGRTGILVPRRDPRAAADAVMKLLNDGRLRLSMGSAGRRLVEQKFDIRNAVTEMMQFFIGS